MSLTEADIDALAESSRFSGVVSIDVDGEPELVTAYGFAHRAHRVPMTPDTASRSRAAARPSRRSRC